MYHNYLFPQQQESSEPTLQIDRKTVRTVLAHCENLLAGEAKRISIHLKRLLCVHYPDIEADVFKFIKFVRSERLPVTSYHIKSRALRAGRNYNHSEFCASNECLQKFIRRYTIQKSFKFPRTMWIGLDSRRFCSQAIDWKYSFAMGSE